jgi:hypothetical protein
MSGTKLVPGETFQAGTKLVPDIHHSSKRRLFVEKTSFWE